MIRVAVIGASGRMGGTVSQAVTEAPDMELVAGVDVGWDPAELQRAGTQVAVDFTVPAAAEDNVHRLIDLGVHAVVGTTGWTDEAYARVREHAAQKPGVGVLIAPNFAISTVLAMWFAAKAAPYFASAEVIELHHPKKLDAPSGTAQATSQAIAAARTAAGLPDSPDATAQTLLGARGAEIDGVHVHAVRLTGLNAHQEILFGNPGEGLTVRADSFDRISFMPGVLLGVRNVAAHPGLTVGLDSYLGLE
jgi:4-hydroxy-tetrahydrodipicolinate reductase